MKKATVIYYAKLEHGVIIEGESFDEVYHAVRLELRSEFGHSLFFDCSSTTIYEGVLLEWSEGEKNMSMHVPVRPIVSMHCMSMDRKTYFNVERSK